MLVVPLRTQGLVLFSNISTEIAFERNNNLPTPAVVFVFYENGTALVPTVAYYIIAGS